MKTLLEGIYDDWDEREFLFFNRLSKRKPKIWTIEKLYNLWLKVGERNVKRRKDVINWMDKIAENIPTETDQYNNEFKIIYNNYRNQEEDNEIYKTKITRSKHFGNSWNSTTSDGTLGQQEGVKNQRDEDIDILLHKEEKLMYGNEYERLSHLSRNHFSSMIMRYIWDMIEKELKEKYTTFNTPKVIPITICGDKFYVSAETGNFPYIKFELMCAATDEVNEF